MKSLKFLSATMISIIVFVACSNASDKEAAGTTDTSPVVAATVDTGDAGKQNLEANKKLIREYIQALYGDKDSTAIDKYISSNIIQHNPLLQDGKDWLKNSLRPFLQNPNIHKTKVDIRQMAAEGDKVWVLIREVAPNGNVYARAEIFRLENGKIAENWLIHQDEPKTSANKNGLF